ncbi:hypothetical protein EHS25_006333 [Saitozyma podzolica]|uniref:Uncharacterized protein n=1 Tax=Saitozyma podzolica TaxID=1890683 RepID=A0A427YRN9_9TREE|nr:hypothetical protein EHS25_006333 [Saitozyma podzolica]
MSDQNDSNKPGSDEGAATSEVDVGPGVMSLRAMISAGNITHGEVMNVITEVSSEGLDKEVRYSKHSLSVPGQEDSTVWLQTREEDLTWADRQSRSSITLFEALSWALDPSNPLTSEYLASTQFPALNALACGAWSIACKLTADRGSTAIVDCVEWKAMQDSPVAQSSIDTIAEHASASNDTDEAKGEPSA